ncbi:Rib/alpha-like domain-containing protein [Gardnerella piotii]|uniref:Rib/alpha-like domain-containing protein n=1 Tax=Gardnerella piotii TaxID=2792977 RepID=UPI0039F0CC22
MLPAGLRGFASRMGRLASRALAWDKSGAESCAAASDTYAARPARALLRALLAMLVAVATLFATFVVPPMHNAKAAQVWWDYAGNGYVTSTGSWVGDAVNQINMPYPTIEDVNYNGETRKKITWTVTFNSQGIGAKSASQNQFPEGNQPSKGSAYGGQPTLYAWLPSGIEDSSITIYREVTVRKTWGGVSNFDWQKARSSKEFPGNHPGDYANFVLGDLGKSRWTYYKGDSNFEGHDWAKSLGPGTGSKVEGVGAGVEGKYAKDYDMCEVYAWKRENKFSRVFISQEKDDSTISHRWTISAIVDRGQNPLLLTFAAGWISAKELKTRFVVSGPFDTDGDGIPDSVEHHHNMNPKSPDDILYPQFNESMLKDYDKDNVPITTYGRKITEKPYIKTGHWQGNSSEGSFVYDGRTSTDLPSDLGIKYSITGISDNTIKIANSPNNISEGYVYIDPNTGHLTYNPRKEDRNKTITFHTKISYPNSGSYNCKHRNAKEFTHDTKIKVVSQASLYNPHYETTEVDSDPSKGTFSPATSVEPKSVRDRKKPWVRVGSLPKGSTFKLEEYGKGSSVLSWSKIDSKNTGNGKVTFSPSKSEAGKSEKTPVVVTYPDGSTSKDKDSGNSGNPVYAPVTVGDLPISGGDLNLGLYDGTSIDNNKFWGFSFRSKTNPHEIDKGKKMGLSDEDNKNPNKGIVFDSWANNGKGPITFRVICHRTDDNSSTYTLLKPAEGNKKASGEINGLHFEDFRQWVRDNDKSCNGKDCKDSNYYLHSSEYNRDTMERSRAMIGGTPREGGSYECKVFAFHENDESKKYTALNQFDGLEQFGVGMQFAYDTSDPAKKTKGSEWVAGSFYFKIKLKDNQKYNPTYVKMPTIQAGKSIKDGRYSSPTKDNISTDQPKSTKAGNGVPEKEQASILDDYLPDGTWFEIKKLLRKVNDKNHPDKFTLKPEDETWSRFEDGEDNVKRDDHGNPVKKNGKVVTLDQPDRDYGAVTFHPDKWQSAGEYWAEVRVHYPDGSTSDGEGSVNEKHPVYAKVTVTPKPDKNKFGLNLFRYTTDSQYRTISVENGIDLHPGDSLSGNGIPKFDAYLTNAVGNLHQHMICSKKDKNGNPTDYTYGILPGHVNNEKSKNENEKDGLRLLEPQTIWKHSSLKDQLECNANSKKCKSNTYLYDDWVDGDKSRDTFERTHAFFVGKAQKTGDYVCKVYVIKGDKESDEFKKAVEGKLEKNTSADPAAGLFDKTKDNKYPYGPEGVGYKTGAFSVHIHKDNQLYNPTYTKIPEIQAGSTFDKNLNNNKAAISSDTPQSKKKVTEGNTEVNANGVPKEDLVNVKEGALPAGTWYEIKRFVKASDIKNSKASSLPWANFEDGEDNVKMKDGKPELNDDKKKQPASDDATGKGSVTFRPDKWQDADDYLAEVRVHYPDGSTSDGEGSINKDHPIYAKVKVTRPAINNPDLHLNVYKQYENGKFTGDVDSKNGIVVMKGVGLLKDMGIDSWSTAKPEGITLRALCRDDSDEARKKQPQVWSENLDNLFFKLNWQQAWKYPTFARQETCRKGSNNGDHCNTGDEHFLFDSTGGTMERARGTITSDKAPTKSGKYYCVVLAMKLTDLGKYKNAIKNSKISVTNNDFAKAMGFTDTEGIDYAAKFFPVTVVDKFSLPKTGGEDCVNWNMLMSVVCVLGTGAMAAGFFLDQTKWGRAMLEALLRKALIKDFICKTAKWCGGVMLRIEWWITERWRC